MKTCAPYAHGCFRLYDPEAGRWLSKDPVLFAGKDSNLYGYTFSDPVNYVDPNEHFGVLGGVLGFFAGAAIGATTGTTSTSAMKAIERSMSTATAPFDILLGKGVNSQSNQCR